MLINDSLNSLLVLTASNVPDPILRDILLLLTSPDKAGKSIVFCWIPWHVDIMEKELADQAARRSEHSSVSPAYYSLLQICRAYGLKK